ncbi:MAG: TMEM14 family protein [archaeon]|nr:TMEM14 family protein [archaeon]
MSSSPLVKIAEYSPYINVVAGVGIAAYGTYGYVKAKSVPSLVSGLLIGDLIVAAGYLTYKNKSNKVGPLVGFSTSSLLALFTARQLAKSRTPVTAHSPAAILAGVSVLLGLVNFLAYKQIA